MSYSILYNTIFLRSAEGITPCILSGCNNCYDAGNRRRDRSWSIFLNRLGTTEEEMLTAIEPWLGGYEEHWMRRNKWVDDAGLIRWVKNNARNAYSLESVLEANHFTSVRCYIDVWGSGYTHSEEDEAICATTQELDIWIRKARKAIDERKASGRSVYPIISFPCEDMRRPQKETLPNAARVLLMHGSMYLKGYQTGSVTWTRSIKDALELTREEAGIILNTYSTCTGIRQARLVNAVRKTMPYNVVLRIKSGSNSGCYVVRRVRGRIRLTNSIQHAYHYADERTAAAALKKIQPAYPACEFEISLDK